MRGPKKIVREFRRNVAMDYIQSGMSRKEIALKYKLPNVQTISNWVSLYLTPLEIQNKCLSLQPKSSKMTDAEETPNSTPEGLMEDEMSARIISLEKMVGKLEKE